MRQRPNVRVPALKYRDAVTATAPTPATPLRDRIVRPEIQALRAVAVVGVVAYHLWPPLITGGFVGVDIFFVVSGFLITGHLMREVESSGRIRLAQFWARRARRLLPAALVVLAVSAVLVLVFVPRIYWLQFLREAAASALYVENWVLAADAVDYLAASNAASAVQHYWSLSIEEQFYLVWPLLILAAAWFARRAGGTSRRTVIALVLAVVVALSLAYSVFITYTNPSAAYFITPARAWEFGLGGLLALVPARWLARSTALRATVSWLGWVVIAVSIYFYSGAIPFPGFSALLPVGAALAVIWAGAPSAKWAPTRLVSLRPVQWVGGISYSFYLWHWPLIVVAPYVVGFPAIAIREKLVILAASIVLAWLTKRFIEDPVRTGALLTTRPPRWTLLAALASVVLVVGPSLAGTAALQARFAADDVVRAQLAKLPCFGAASLDPELECSDAEFPVISPEPALAPKDSPDIYFTDPPCFSVDTEVQTCSFGPEDSPVRIVLIGDSHAAQWQPALQRIAESRGWYLQLFLKTNCVFTATDRSPAYDKCASWADGVTSALDSLPPFTVAITGSYAQLQLDEVSQGLVSGAAVAEGFHEVWAPLVARGTTVVALRDTPYMQDTATMCVSQHVDDETACDVPRDVATAHDDLLYDAARGHEGVIQLDLDDLLCAPTTCSGVVGGVAVRTDPFHTTQTFSRTQAPYLERDLIAVLDANGVDLESVR